jgi:hypothetical protein
MTSRKPTRQTNGKDETVIYAKWRQSAAAFAKTLMETCETTPEAAAASAPSLVLKKPETWQRVLDNDPKIAESIVLAAIEHLFCKLAPRQRSQKLSNERTKLRNRLYDYTPRADLT